VRSPISHGGGWHEEFVRQQQQNMNSKGKGAAQYNGSSMYAPPQPAMQMGMDYQYQNPTFATQMSQPVSQPMQQTYVEPQFHEPAFDAAFDEAMKEMEALQSQDMTQEEGRSEMQPETSESPASLEKSSIRIGSDTIEHSDRTNQTPEQTSQDADALARTAGQLLNLVSHDTSTKFQNSAFLDLMRRIRDREVEVQGDDLKATGSNTVTPESQVEAVPPGLQDMRPHDTTSSTPSYTRDEVSSQFAFPNLDSVYEPTAADLEETPQPSVGTWTAQPMQNTPAGRASDADAMYTSAADEYPANAADLHPGGRWYPEMHSPRMSGARVA
jgi:hypothetical protein